MSSTDQTGQYSTQVFSLAVLLSSLFVYNQMGGIDEAALDRLSLVTEMSKHIAIQADSSENTNQVGSLLRVNILHLLISPSRYLASRSATSTQVGLIIRFTLCLA